MREEMVNRESYWVVEAVDRNGRVVFNKEYNNFDLAWEKYYSFKGKFTVSLQRRYREFKIAM